MKLPALLTSLVLPPWARIVLRFWHWGAIALLLSIIAWQHFSHGKKEARLQAAIATLEARNAEQIAEWHAAYAKAVEAAHAEKAEKELAYEKARNAAAQVRERIRTVYVGRVMQLPEAADDRRCALAANLPELAERASLPAGAARETGFPQGYVCITRADALIVADLMSYAESAHAWVMELRGG